MSVHHRWFIYCDGPRHEDIVGDLNEAHDGDATHALGTLDEYRSVLKREGWKHVKRKGNVRAKDYCPECRVDLGI